MSSTSKPCTQPQGEEVRKLAQHQQSANNQAVPHLLAMQQVKQQQDMLVLVQAVLNQEYCMSWVR